MNLLDRIAAQKMLSMILDFILKIIKIFVPTPQKDLDETIPPKKRRWRRK